MQAAATSSKQRPDPHGNGTRGGGGGDVDRISCLPDGILCEIVSLLPTKDAARTQALASRWAHLWRAAPLNLDYSGLASSDNALGGVVSTILSAHPGPGRRFCVPARFLHDRAAAMDAWLRSPALDHLQELEFCSRRRRPPATQRPSPPPASAFLFSATLCVATIGHCHIADDLGHTIRFPQLKQLALQRVRISEDSLHSVISSCPALEYLLLGSSYGFRRLRIINSSTIQSIGVIADYSGPDLRLEEIVIKAAPSLERLVCAERVGIHVSVMAAPKLETVGCLSTWNRSSRVVFGSTVFQGLHLVSLTTVVCSVKILAVDSLVLTLDMVIDLMKCFPCLERLYIKGNVSGEKDRPEKNHWRRKQKEFIRCFDIRLKTIVLEGYQGTMPLVNFASFFVLNARELELMSLVVGREDYNEEFFAQQHRMLRMEKRASRGARLDFTTNRHRRYLLHINHVRDLSIADPFECTCWLPEVLG